MQIHNDACVLIGWNIGTVAHTEFSAVFRARLTSYCYNFAITYQLYISDCLLVLFFLPTALLNIFTFVNHGQRIGRIIIITIVQTFVTTTSFLTAHNRRSQVYQNYFLMIDIIFQRWDKWFETRIGICQK